MIPKRLLAKKKLSVSDLERISISEGGHNSRSSGVCAMEAVAWLAGREHSDSPVCVSPVIAAFMRSWNDCLKTDEDRNRLLRPLLPSILETASDNAVEIRRSWMAIDWLIRTMAPAFLDLSLGLHGDAASLRSLPEVTPGSWTVTEKTMAAAGDAARAAARAAARD